MDGRLFQAAHTAVIRTADGYPVTVHAGPTRVPGLAVVPAVRSDGVYTGGWQLLHTASGHVIGEELDHPDLVRLLADELAAGPLNACDWTRPSAPRRRYAEQVLQTAESFTSRQEDRRRRITAALR